MKKVNLSPLKNNDLEYKKIITLISEKFNGNWDDNIYESFRLFIKQISNNADSVHRVRSKAEMILKEINELNIDEQLNKALDLCGEADLL